MVCKIPNVYRWNHDSTADGEEDGEMYRGRGGYIEGGGNVLGQEGIRVVEGGYRQMEMEEYFFFLFQRGNIEERDRHMHK